MTPIEDRLNEYTSTLLSAGLSQFEVAPAMALSLRRSVHLDRQLARSGIVPGDPVELPANITPELLNTLFTEGDDSMNTQSNPTRVRIHSHITQSRFLHVEDALSIGKIRLFAGSYRKGHGINANGHAPHFIDLADARVIFSALARGEQGFAHKEYKGTPPQTRHLDKLGAGSERRPKVVGRRNGGTAVSRVLSIAVKGENVYIELKTGPGKLTNTGAITPNGQAIAEVNVGFKLYEARRMAASVLAYIHAWDVMRMMYHHGVVGNQDMVSKPSPYLLVSTTSEANGVKTNGVPEPNGATRSPVVAADNGRPVTRKTAQPAAKAKPTPITNSLPPQRRGGRSPNGHGKQNGNGSQPQRLLYGDGTPVAAGNQTERSTYASYQEAKGVIPPSKSALQQFYQQQVVA
jgi:hypothetical protein